MTAVTDLPVTFLKASKGSFVILLDGWLEWAVFVFGPGPV
jgi:hypothetical protein